MDSLATIFARHSGPEGVDIGMGDKGSTHSYIETYERLLAPFREKCDLLEIGLAQGWSLDMWGEYLGPESTITGVDISVTFDVSRFDQRFTIIEADATKPQFLSFAKCPDTFDIIIDDGSHMQTDQCATFNLLKHRMRPGGLYIIEDIISPEQSLSVLTALHPRAEVFDLRSVKRRFDDLLVVFRF